MAGFDTSNVAATVGQGVPQPNALETVSHFAALQNALNQNREFQARIAAGRAFQGAINPDGTVNANRLSTGLQDPRAALFAAPMLGEGASVTGQNIANVTGQQGLASNRIEALRKTIGGIPPGPKQTAQALEALHRGVQTGLWTAEDAAAYTGNGLPDLIPASAIQSGSESAQAAQFGTPTAINTGPGTVVENVNRAAGTISPMGFIQSAQTPSEMGQLVTYTDAQGVTHEVPKSVVQTGQGTPIPNVPGITGPHGEIATGIGPQAMATATGTGAAQAQAAAGLQARAQDVPQRKANLDILQNTADEFQPGPQSGWWLHMQGLAQEYGIPLPGGPPANKVAAQQEFNKVATMVLASQRQATGMSATDQQTQLAGMAAPNAELSRDGIRRVIGTLKANEDLYNAQYQLWEKAKTDPRYSGLPFDQFQARFNRNVNPLVFQALYADPSERAKIIKHVGPEKFKAQYKALYNQGLISNAQ